MTTTAKMRRLAAAGAVMLLGLAACSSLADGESGNDSGPIVIGAAIAESGLFETYDMPVIAAAEGKINEINEAGGIDGRQVELRIVDTKSDIKRGGQAAQQLIDGGAEIILVSADFDFGSSAAAVAQRAGLVTITLGASSPKFGVQAIGDKAFSFKPSTGNQSSVLATFAKKEGYTRAFTLEDTTLSYTRGINAAFKKFFEAGGGTVVGEDTFNNDDSSIAAQINKIKSAKPDVLMLSSYPPGGASALRQIRAAGIDIPIVSAEAFDDTAWIEAAAGLNDFFVATQVSVAGDDANPAVNAWVKDFTAATGAPPERGNAAVGYAIIEALEIAIEEAGMTDGDELARAIQAFDGVELLTGPVSFSEREHILLNSPMVIIEFNDGKPTYLETVAPDKAATITDGVA